MKALSAFLLVALALVAQAAAQEDNSCYLIQSREACESSSSACTWCKSNADAPSFCLPAGRTAEVSPLVFTCGAQDTPDEDSVSASELLFLGKSKAKRDQEPTAQKDNSCWLIQSQEACESAGSSGVSSVPCAWCKTNADAPSFCMPSGQTAEVDPSVFTCDTSYITRSLARSPLAHSNVSTNDDLAMVPIVQWGLEDFNLCASLDSTPGGKFLCGLVITSLEGYLEKNSIFACVRRITTSLEKFFYMAVKLAEAMREKSLAKFRDGVQFLKDGLQNVYEAMQKCPLLKPALALFGKVLVSLNNLLGQALTGLKVLLTAMGVIQNAQDLIFSYGIKDWTSVGQATANIICSLTLEFDFDAKCGSGGGNVSVQQKRALLAQYAGGCPKANTGCKACVLAGGGTGCKSRCNNCSGSCIGCIAYKGGKACAPRCLTVG